MAGRNSCPRDPLPSKSPDRSTGGAAHEGHPAIHTGGRHGRGARGRIGEDRARRRAPDRIGRGRARVLPAVRVPRLRAQGARRRRHAEVPVPRVRPDVHCAHGQPAVQPEAPAREVAGVRVVHGLPGAAQGHRRARRRVARHRLVHAHARLRGAPPHARAVRLGARRRGPGGRHAGRRVAHRQAPQAVLLDAQGAEVARRPGPRARRVRRAAERRVRHQRPRRRVPRARRARQARRRAGRPRAQGQDSARDRGRHRHARRLRKAPSRDGRPPRGVQVGDARGEAAPRGRELAALQAQGVPGALPVRVVAPPRAVPVVVRVDRADRHRGGGRRPVPVREGVRGVLLADEERAVGRALPVRGVLGHVKRGLTQPTSKLGTESTSNSKIGLAGASGYPEQSYDAPPVKTVSTSRLAPSVPRTLYALSPEGVKTRRVPSHPIKSTCPPEV